MNCKTIASFSVGIAFFFLILFLGSMLCLLSPTFELRKTERQIQAAHNRAHILYIESHAQKEANLLISGSLDPKILRMQAIQKWNGHLPEVIPGWRGIMPMINIDIDE